MIQPHWWLIETIGHPAVAGWHSSSPHIVPDSVSGKFCRKLSFWQISGGFVTLDSGLGFKAQYLQSGASTEIVCAPSGLDRVYRPEFLAPSRLPSAYRRGLSGPSSRSLSTCTARRFGLSPYISGYPGHMPGHPIPHEPPGAPSAVSIRTPQHCTTRHSGLLPAALLGLLGLPLIIDAGPASELPNWTYAAGLVLALGLGLQTIVRTTRTNRYAAIVATVLLAALCVVQMTDGRARSVGPKTDQTPRVPRVPKDDGTTRTKVEKNDLLHTRKTEDDR